MTSVGRITSRSSTSSISMTAATLSDASPFVATSLLTGGGSRLLYLLGYHQSVATGVGFIALAGV